MKENWGESSTVPATENAREREALLACVFDPDARATHVRDAARWSWKGYRECAGAQDELRPLSCSGQHWLNLTLTAVDGLDTLFIMGLEQEFKESMDIVTRNFAPHSSKDCNLFETTIRVLGALLATHQLAAPDTNQSAVARTLLEMAADLGSRLAVAFESESGIPYSDVNLATGSRTGSVELSSTSELGTLSLEFTALARLTGRSHFETAALRVHDVISSAVESHNGLLPQHFSREKAFPSGHYIMLGARTDSYYEYLLKQWIMTGQQDTRLLGRFQDAMHSVRSRLVHRTKNDKDGLFFIAEEQGAQIMTKMDHLVCFLPGLLALADFHNVSTVRQNGSTEDLTDLELAHELAHTCYQLYRRTPSGLAPEIVVFVMEKVSDAYPGSHPPDTGGGDFIIRNGDAHTLLRPETVESFYILWKVTGDPIYREWAWQIFRAFELWARVDESIPSSRGGYSSLESVLELPPRRRDKMESFWLAETLKYLYLIFIEAPDRCLHPSCADDASSERRHVLPLTKFVLNTEAHPLLIVGPENVSLVRPVPDLDPLLFDPYQVEHGADDVTVHDEL